jgi:AcrR family transcriptional regulator
MSLYHHYPSKAHLLDALLDRLLATLEVPDPGLHWRERAVRICRACRDLASAHPRFAPYMIVHRMNTRVTLAVLESMVRIFSDAGFEDAEEARAFRATGYYLMGAILDETSGYARGPTAAELVPEAEQALIAPTVLRYGRYFEKQHWDATFENGLDALLDELERRLRKDGRRAPPRRRD